MNTLAVMCIAFTRVTLITLMAEALAVIGRALSKHR
jgi:hypothetical protein